MWSIIQTKATYVCFQHMSLTTQLTTSFTFDIIFMTSIKTSVHKSWEFILLSDDVCWIPKKKSVMLESDNICAMGIILNFHFDSMLKAFLFGRT